MNQVPLLQVSNLKKYFPLRKGILSRTVGWVQAVDAVSFTLTAWRDLRTGRRERMREDHGGTLPSAID